MAVRITENHDNDDPFKKLLERLPNFSFPRVETGLNRTLFGLKSETHLQMGAYKSRLLEVDTRESEIVTKANEKTKEEIKELTKEEQNEIVFLNAALNFNRNPRFEGTEFEELIAEPKEVIFTNYIPYRPYTAKLVIRNLSKHSHRFRVQYSSGQTFSQFFKFILKDSPTKDEGLIAAGLCSVYTIFFSPDSFGNFKEDLLVISETGAKLYVPIIASNDPPQISLPKEIYCGECRPGFSISSSFAFSNTGGYSRFVIMQPGEKRTAFQLFDCIRPGSRGDESAVVIGKFEVSPGYFEIDKNETVTITVKYSPTIKTLKDEKIVDIETMLFACDRCSTHSFQLSGTTQNPKMNIIEGYFCNRNRAVLPDPSLNLDGFDFKLDFLSGNDFATDVCFLTMKNSSGLTLKFKWVKADFMSNNTQFEESRFKNSFECIPDSGVFDPWTEMKFIIRFCPEEIKTYDMVVEMLLIGETRPDDDYPRRKSMFKDETNECLSRIRLQGKGIAYTATVSKWLIPIPANLQSGDFFMSSLDLQNTSISEMNYSWSVLNINQKMVSIEISNESGMLASNNSTSIGIKLTAYLPGYISATLVCETANGIGPSIRVNIIGHVQMKPRSLVFDSDFIDFGLFALGESRIIYVPLINTTPYKMTWNISSMNPVKNKYLLQIHPSTGTLGSDETCQVALQYYPTWYEKLQDTLRIHLISIDIPKYADGITKYENIVLEKPMLMSAIDMVAVVQTPWIQLLNNKNSFSCFLNVPVKWKIDLKNVRQLPTYFKWPEIENDTLIASFYPSSGMLEGGKTIQIEVEIRFLIPGAVEVNLVGEVKDMVEDNGNLILNLDVEVVQYEFSFRVLENEDAWASRAIMTSSKQRKASETALRLDFGLLCPISDVRSRTIRIRNHSAIESQFKVEFKTYTPTLGEEEVSISAVKPLLILTDKLTPPSKTVKTPRRESKVPALLKSTQRDRIGFSSKSGQTYVESITKFRALINRMKQILSDGRGAAFHAVPHEGVIKPWGEVEIKVNAYNNLVGIYKDEMICQVEDITQQFPVRLGVVGTPVKFSGAHLISREKEVKLGGIDVEKVNFGARVIDLTAQHPFKGSSNKTNNLEKHKRERERVPTAELHSGLSNADTISKVISVDNNSPRDVFLDWRVYIKHLTESQISSQDVKDVNITTEMVIRPENLIEKGGMGIIAVTPSSMTIPAFKSQQIKCLFRNVKLGSYISLVIADIAYIQTDGSYKYAPKASPVPGKWPTEEPIDEKMLASGNVKLEYLESVAVFGINAKCIEPKLSLDGIDYIKVKYTRQHQAGEKIVTIAFIDNRSDAICEFTLSANPPDVFKVRGSKKNIKIDHKKKTKKVDGQEQVVYELKQTQQIMITIDYTPKSLFSSKPVTPDVITVNNDTPIIAEEAVEKSLDVVEFNGICENQIAIFPDDDVGISTKDLFDAGNSRKDLFASCNIENSTRGSAQILYSRRPSLSALISHSKNDLLIINEESENTILPVLASNPQLAVPSIEIPLSILAKGKVVIYFTNGMTQEIPVYVIMAED